jgi:hypothetical protein
MLTAFQEIMPYNDLVAVSFYSSVLSAIFLPEA